MRFEQGAPLWSRISALGPQVRIGAHFADRHAGGFQAAEEFDPDQDRGIVVPLAGAIPISTGQQPDPLVIADRMDR